MTSFFACARESVNCNLVSIFIIWIVTVIAKNMFSITNSLTFISSGHGKCEHHFINSLLNQLQLTRFIHLVCVFPLRFSAKKDSPPFEGSISFCSFSSTYVSQLLTYFQISSFIIQKLI